MARFSQIYQQYVEPVYYFLLELCGDDRLAEELTRKTFYQAFLHVDSFENRGSVFDWLCRIGKDIYLNAGKRRSHAVSKPEIRTLSKRKPQDPSPDPKWYEEELTAAERKKRIRHGLRKIQLKWVCTMAAATMAVLLIFLGAALFMGGFLRK